MPRGNPICITLNDRTGR